MIELAEGVGGGSMDAIQAECACPTSKWKAESSLRTPESFGKVEIHPDWGIELKRRERRKRRRNRGEGENHGLRT